MRDISRPESESVSSEQITHILLVEDNDGMPSIIERKRAKKDGERVLEKNASMAEIGDIVGLLLSTEDVSVVSSFKTRSIQ